MQESPERVECPFALSTKQGSFLCTYLREEKTGEADGKISWVTDDSYALMFPKPISKFGCFDTFRCECSQLTFPLISRTREGCLFPEIVEKEGMIIKSAKDSIVGAFHDYKLTKLAAIGAMFLLYRWPALLDKEALTPGFCSDFDYLPARMYEEGRLLLSDEDQLAFETASSEMQKHIDAREQEKWSDELL